MERSGTGAAFTPERPVLQEKGRRPGGCGRSATWRCVRWIQQWQMLASVPPETSFQRSKPSKQFLLAGVSSSDHDLARLRNINESEDFLTRAVDRNALICLVSLFRPLRQNVDDRWGEHPPELQQHPLLRTATPDDVGNVRLRPGGARPEARLLEGLLQYQLGRDLVLLANVARWLSSSTSPNRGRERGLTEKRQTSLVRWPHQNQKGGHRRSCRSRSSGSNPRDNGTAIPTMMIPIALRPAAARRGPSSAQNQSPSSINKAPSFTSLRTNGRRSRRSTRVFIRYSVA